MQQDRIAKIKNKFKLKQVDSVFIFKKENIGYLTSVNLEDSLLVITKNKNFLFTSPIYFYEVKSIIDKSINLIKTSSILSSVKKLIKKEKIKNIFFEVDVPYSTFVVFQKILKDVNFIPKQNIVESLRIIKEPYEINYIREATKIAESGFDYLLSILKSGYSEKFIKEKFEFYLKNNCNADKIGFDTIIASGLRSSYPHAKTTKNKIENNNFVIVDWGIYYSDYCCDITRTLFIGKPNKEQVKIYNAVYDTQMRIIEKIKEGISCRELYKIACSLFEEKNLLKYFIHGLGHGIGREVHELPKLGKKSKDILKENMIITIEPGLYIQGAGGVRIEDIIKVTSFGCEVLTNIKKKIIIL